MNEERNVPIEDDDDKLKQQKKREKQLDDELEQTFPASDPPSYSQPHNEEDDK